MNKKNNRKGFTTVELVIVIAVIAILATVLIPTFSNLINKANDSAALQEATSAVKAIAIYNADPDNTTKIGDSILKVGDYYFGMIDGQLVKATSTTSSNVTTYTIEAGTYDYTFTISSGAIANLKLGETDCSTGSAVTVTDVSPKVSIYPINP